MLYKRQTVPHVGRFQLRLFLCENKHLIFSFFSLSNFSCSPSLFSPLIIFNISLFLSSGSTLSANSCLSAAQKWLRLADSTDKRLNAYCQKRTAKGREQEDGKQKMLWELRKDKENNYYFVSISKKPAGLVFLHLTSKTQTHFWSQLSIDTFNYVPVMYCVKYSTYQKRDLLFYPVTRSYCISGGRTFAFTSNSDEGSGKVRVGENKGGLRSSCTSQRH